LLKLLCAFATGALVLNAEYVFGTGLNGGTPSGSDTASVIPKPFDF